MLLAKYNTANIDKFLNDIEKYSIGMDEWFHRLGTVHETSSNYPPYNLIKESETEFRLEIALAGYKKEDIEVFKVVPNHSPVLLPTPGLILRPIVEEFFLDEWAVVVVREILRDRIEGVFQHHLIPGFLRGKPEVDQVGRCVVAD